MTSNGYMYKNVRIRPDWIKNNSVNDIYSVSNCVSEDFDDWLDEWKHNGYCLFDSPEIMESIAEKKGIDMSQMKLFFYKASAKQWGENGQELERHSPGKPLPNVQVPKETKLEGYDVASIDEYGAGRCSPLSCNSLAETIKVNKHCLLDSYDEALRLIESGDLLGCDFEPYRIFEVHSVVLA